MKTIILKNLTMKSEKIKKILLIFMISTCMINCSNNELQEDNLEFEFRLLNKNGQVSTEFQENENFVFSFLIINNYSEEVYFTKFLDMENFFTVKKKENDIETLIGKPYASFLCEFKIHNFKISAKDTLKIEIQWKPVQPYLPDAPYYSSYFCKVNGDNEMLPSGNYLSNFTSDFEYVKDEQSFKVPKKHFNINFTIN